MRQIALRKIEICVADEFADISIIKTLIPEGQNIRQISEIEGVAYPLTNHGTLCTALLANSLHHLELANCVNITHFSISTSQTGRSYEMLLKAFDYCGEHNVDILSLSVGLSNRIYSQEMWSHISNLSHTLIVAAASNSFTLTYPAAFSEVLGIKRAESAGMPKYTQRFLPPDGIEVIANFPANFLVDVFQKEYGIICCNSNSVLPPQVCAEIVAKYIETGKEPTKDLALKWLTNGLETKEEKFYLPCSSKKKDDEKIPIILLPYTDSIAGEALEKAQELKRVFEKNDYACAIISEIFDVCDQIYGFYRLDLEQCTECIKYYQSALSDSLILVLSTKCHGGPIDMIITEWLDCDTTELYQYILHNFSTEVADEDQ